MKALMQLCLNCPGLFTQNEFAILKQHLSLNYSTMAMSNLQLYTEGVCFICSKQEHTSQIKQALADLLHEPLSYIQSFSLQAQVTGSQNLMKAIFMLTGAVKALQTLPIETLQVTLFPMIQQSLNSMIAIISQEHQLRLGKEIVLSSCNLI